MAPGGAPGAGQRGTHEPRHQPGERTVLSHVGEVAVLTGASTGIGEASARRLRANGWTVYAAPRRAERLEALADETGAIAAPCDVTSEADVAALRDRLLGEQGRIDALLNISGGARGTDWVADAKDEDWEQMYRANVLWRRPSTTCAWWRSPRVSCTRRSSR